MYSSILSFTKKQWSLETHDVNKTRALELEHGLSPLVARCFAPILKDGDPQEWLRPFV